MRHHNLSHLSLQFIYWEKVLFTAFTDCDTEFTVLQASLHCEWSLISDISDCILDFKVVTKW